MSNAFSGNFIRDVRAYLRLRNTFNFDGSLNYYKKYVRLTTINKKTGEISEIVEYSTDIWNNLFSNIVFNSKGIAIWEGQFKLYKAQKLSDDKIQYDKNGVDGVTAFYNLDTHGKIIPTKHPNILHTLLKAKGSVNLHIEMYAQSLAESSLNKIEFRAWCIYCWKSPDWFRKAVEEQRWKYIKNHNQ